MTFLRGLGGTLDRYVLLRLLAVWGLCILGFVLLFLVVDATSRVDEFLSAQEALRKSGRTVLGTAVQYYASRVPIIAATVGPYLTLFAGIATILTLSRHNEYVPMLMAGRSVHRVLLPVYAFAIGTVGVFIAFEEYVVPRAERENAILERIVKKKGQVELKKIPHLRSRGNVFAVSRWNPAERTLSGVSCPAFRDPDGKLPEGALEVGELLWRRHEGRVGWYPRDGVLRPAGLSAEDRVQPEIRLRPDVPVVLGFDPTEIDLLAAGGEPGITRKQLLALREIHPEQHELTFELHQRFTRPMSSLVLLLLGVALVAGPEKKSIAQGLGVALLACVAYFFTDFLFRELGMRGDLNPAVAAWTPTVLFLSLAVALFDGVTT